MAKQLGVAGDVAYTCETAAHFWLLHVLARWEKFVAAAEASRADGCVQVCGLLACLPFEAVLTGPSAGCSRVLSVAGYG